MEEQLPGCSNHETIAELESAVALEGMTRERKVPRGQEQTM